jgi:hypothetical protein
MNIMQDDRTAMAKTPDSSKSESWTARIPNHLASAAREHAIAIGMTREDGTANTTEIIHAALKQWVGITDNSTNSVEPSVVQRLESQIAELFDKLSNTVSRSELEATLVGVHASKPSQEALLTDVRKKRVTPRRQAESPIGTQQLCKLLGVNYQNLSTRGKKHDRTTDEQLIAEALEKGAHWRVCDRNGRSLLWERVS